MVHLFGLTEVVSSDDDFGNLLGKNPRDAIGDKAERDHDRGIEARQRLWMQQHGIE